MKLQIPAKFEGFCRPHRYKGAYGGRGSGKSWTVASLLVNFAARQPELIVCAREFQNSIDDSVHRLLANRISHYQLPFEINKYSIKHKTLDSEFIFKGLSKLDAASIKSLEGAHRLWVEEGQNVSHASWENTIPTIRRDDSEIWVTWNPTVEDAPTQQRFVTNPPPDSYIVKVNWNDNPWFPKVLEQERLHMLETDPVAYRNVWEGEPRTFSEGAYFKEEMDALERAGRIGDVPYDPAKPVYTFWDLGWDDSTAIWFIQQADGNAYHAIDYWEGSNVPLPMIARDVIQGRPYHYAKHVIPHDGGNGNRQTGKTDRDILEGLGLKVDVQERTKDKQGDVHNIRLLLPKMRFDRGRCKNGLAALKHYRQEQNPKTGLWQFKHDWTSHGVDAFRYFSVLADTIGTQTSFKSFRRGLNPMTM